jgi:putative transposase
VPRQLRYFLPDIPQHVVIRGVDRQATFFAPDDYALFVEALGDSAHDSGCLMHAYVLMTNHVHLLLTPLEARSIPRLMQGLGRYYVQALNRRYQRTGPLWQGRYKACLVQADDYFLACQQYVELNPVRAGMVSDPAHYPHSSYRSHALGTYNALLTNHDCYNALGRSSIDRGIAYRRTFEATLDRPLVERIREMTNACRVLGNEKFTTQIEEMMQRRVRPAKMGRPKKSLTS